MLLNMIVCALKCEGSRISLWQAVGNIIQLHFRIIMIPSLAKPHMCQGFYFHYKPWEWYSSPYLHVEQVLVLPISISIARVHILLSIIFRSVYIRTYIYQLTILVFTFPGSTFWDQWVFIITTHWHWCVHKHEGKVMTNGFLVWGVSSWVACFQISKRAPQGVVVLQFSELHNLGLWHLTLERWYSSHVMSCQSHPPSLCVRCFSGVKFWLSVVPTFNGGLCRASGAHLLRLFPCRGSGSAWFGLCSLICCWLNGDTFFVDCSIAKIFNILQTYSGFSQLTWNVAGDV